MYCPNCGILLTEAKKIGWGDKSKEYTDWRNQVDSYVRAIAGVGCDDLPDYDYALAFQSNFDPEETAREVLEEAGFTLPDQE